MGAAVNQPTGAERRCPQCERDFTPKRDHAVCCSPECRYQHWIEEQINGAEDAPQRVRRPSREGRGARLYLDWKEIAFLRQFPRQKRYRGDLLAGRLMLKLDRAAERIERNGHQ